MKRATRRFHLGGSRVRVRRSPVSEIQLASTSDVAFLLLIFFLASAVFVSQLGLPMTLPPAGASPVTVKESDVVTLAIDDAGTIRAEGQPLAWREVTAWARQKEREKPGRVYLLEVDPKCQYSALVTGLDALRAAPVETISFRLSGQE